MFNDAVNVLDYVAEDYIVLAKYVQSFPFDSETGLPTIPADSIYSDKYGDGRITILSEEQPETEPESVVLPETDEILTDDSFRMIPNRYYGIGSLWKFIHLANSSRN